MNIRISTIEIPVAKLDRAVAWYKNSLGFNLEWSDKFHALLRSESEDENVNLLLVETQDRYRLNFRSSHTDVAHSVLDFETDSLEEMHASLKKNIPDLMNIPEPKNEWAPKGFSLEDSEGNRIAVFSYNK